MTNYEKYFGTLEDTIDTLSFGAWIVHLTNWAQRFEDLSNCGSDEIIGMWLESEVSE